MPGETIWVIDDEDSLIRLYEERFKEAGFYFEGFSEADTPFNRLNQGDHAPHVVICDFGMKRGRNGYEFFRDAAEHLEDTVKYMVTALPAEAAQVRELDGVGYVQKPMNLAGFIKQIEADLEAVQSLDE